MVKRLSAVALAIAQKNNHFHRGQENIIRFWSEAGCQFTLKKILTRDSRPGFFDPIPV